MGTIDLAGGALLELCALAFLAQGLGASCFLGTGFGSGLSCGTAWLFVLIGLALLFTGMGIQILAPSETDLE